MDKQRRGIEANQAVCRDEKANNRSGSMVLEEVHECIIEKLNMNSQES